MNDDAMAFLDVPVLFGRFLVLHDILSEAEIAQAARVQKELNAYPVFRLIEQGTLTIEDVTRARAYQWKHMATFCEAVDALRILALDDCTAAMKGLARQNIPLGEVLVRQGKMTPKALADALEKHRQSRASDRVDVVDLT
jgi:hypothetical protein